ncbi:hypothetical protein ABCS02_14010 [Microbacterium sp. X-17]|uniref:hypothetical protein n=1 Tax=Microbacterium sp. X-17 TaxID=3144404 RepID=UPI0031F57B0E
MSVVRSPDGIDPRPDDMHGTPVRTPIHPRPLGWYLWRGALFGALGVVALVAVLILVVPMVAGGHRYPVGNSSALGVPSGSLAVVHPSAAIAVGDIVAVPADAGTVDTREVAALSTDARGGVVLLTDGGAAGLEPVPVSDVSGVLWYAIPGLGWVGGLLAGPVQMWALPAIAVVLFGYLGTMSVRAIVDGRRRRRGEGADEV